MHKTSSNWWTIADYIIKVSTVGKTLRLSSFCNFSKLVWNVFHILKPSFRKFISVYPRKTKQMFKLRDLEKSWKEICIQSLCSRKTVPIQVQLLSLIANLYSNILKSHCFQLNFFHSVVQCSFSDTYIWILAPKFGDGPMILAQKCKHDYQRRKIVL